jgi:16S rRNA (cytosine967-C5)-methyltransferase
MNARLLAIQILNRILKTDAYADILLDHAYRKYSLSFQDRSLTTELVMGTLRWLGRIDWILQHTYAGAWDRIPEMIRRDMEIALYQILYTDRIPVYAAVNEAVDIAKVEGGNVWGRRVNGVLRECVRQHQHFEFPSIEENPIESISVQWSHPAWLVKKMIDLWGVKKTISICQANNERPQVSIRMNLLRNNKDQILTFLYKEKIEFVDSDILDEFLVIKKLDNLLQTEMFHKGWFSVQDMSAGLVGHLVQPQQRDRILELAAAPGGKTSHMAEISGDRANIFSMDINLTRMRKLVQNQKRLGLEFIYPFIADGRYVSVGTFDKVLLDAPCSGLGVLRKHPEIRWRCTTEQINQLKKNQKALLETAHRHVKKDGILVYSTCTILPEENEEMISYFLQIHPEYTIDYAADFVDRRVVNEGGLIKTWPDEHDMDGSCAVRLRKGG